MKNVLTKVLVAAVAATALATGPVVPAEAAPKKKSQCIGSSYSGRCWEFVSAKKKVTVVEAVPLENFTRKKRANMHCSFSRTITRSITKTAGLSSSAEVSAVFGLAKVNVSATISKSVQQSGSQATTAGGSVTLKPKESVTCQRTYGHYVTKLRTYTYTGVKVSSKKTITTKIPISLGVRIVD